MTLQEKVNVLSTSFSVPRLGIRNVGQIEGLHGLALGGPGNWGNPHSRKHITYPTTIFPQAYGLGEIWDTALIRKVANIEATEARYYVQNPNLQKGGLVVGAPGNFSKDVPYHINQLIIGAMRNWSKNVIEWNLASSPDYKPHTQGGCNICLGGITLQGDSVTRNPGYYIIAHAAKFVRPGSVRIASNRVLGLNDVAFKTPAGKIVLIVINNGKNVQNFDVWFHGQVFQSSLNSKSVGTYAW